MRLAPLPFARAVVALCAAMLAACDSSTSTDGVFTIALSSAQASLSQGLSTALTLSIERTELEQPVAFTVEGLPPGVTAAVNPNPVTGESTILLLTAEPTTPAGTANVTVRATAEGAAEQTAEFGLEVLIAGEFTLGALEPTVTVAQGGGERTAILVNREGGFIGSVALALSGAPAGLTAALDASSTAGSSVSLAFAAAASLPVGSYPITVTGSSEGVPDQETTVTVNVIATPPTASLTMTFCPGALPLFFAYKNEGFPWQPATRTGSSYTFAATERLAVLTVFITPDGDDKQSNVTYGLRGEFTSFTGRDCTGTQRANGTATGFGSTQHVRVTMGPVALNAPVTPSTPNYSFLSLPDRTMDLVGTSGTSGSTFIPDKMIILRDLDPPDNSTLPTLDFGSADAFTLQQGTLTIEGPPAADGKTVAVTYWSKNTTFGAVQGVGVTGGAVPYFGVPLAKQAAGEIHELFVDHYPGQSLAGHSILSYFAAPGNRSETLGPFVNAPNLTMITSSPYLRLRARVEMQVDYQSAMRVLFFHEVGANDTRSVYMQVSAGYLGGTPAVWDLSVPDFSGLAGFSNAWMPGATAYTIWQVVGFSGRVELLSGARPVDGDLLRFSDRTGERPSNTVLRAGGLPARRALPRSQYFRR